MTFLAGVVDVAVVPVSADIPVNAGFGERVEITVTTGLPVLSEPKQRILRRSNQGKHLWPQIETINRQRKTLGHPEELTA